MLLASTLQPTDSQVDGQTWHDLDMHRVFDQLNHTQSSIGAEALYQKMRLINFQPDASLQELEDFFEHHPDLSSEGSACYEPVRKKEPQYG